MIKAAIFDYNSTLYFDKDISMRGWKNLYIEYIGKEEGSDRFAQEAVYGNNRVSSTKLMVEKGEPINEEKLAYLSHRKEELYQSYAKEEGHNKLAPGAEELLNELIRKGIRVNLCTASIRFNLDFYYENTKLDRWFDREKVSYDDGQCKDKVEMYKRAAAVIGVSPEECIVFEDSIKGMKDAIEAGYTKIIDVNHYGRKRSGLKEVIQEVDDFTQVDKTLFE